MIRNPFSSSKQAASTTDQEDNEARLDQILYEIPGTDQDITWAEAIEGTLILGETGSGKTSGPGRHAALAMLKAGWGFLVLCAKTDEKDRWVEYIEEHAQDRLNDLVIFNKEEGLQFNFLKYELTRKGEGAGEIINAINTIMNLNEQSKIYQSGSGTQSKEEPFWDHSLRRLISRAIALLIITDQDVSIENMRKIVASCPKEEEPKDYFNCKKTLASTEQIAPEERQKAKDYLEWMIKQSYCLQLIQIIENTVFKTEKETQEAEFVRNYWLRELPRVGDRVLGIVTESFMGVVEAFLSDGILRNQFSTGLDEQLIPENIIAQRKIVIIDFSIKEFGLAGIFASIIYKSAFMAAMERRNIHRENEPIPICLWIDEYQNFCNPAMDTLFQLTARSSWVATVYITQNILNLYFVMGATEAQAKAKSLLSNLNLKYFASNSEYDTNLWASQMIGQHLTDYRSLSLKENKAEKIVEPSISKSQHKDYKVAPEDFTTLKRGRSINDFIVEAIVFKAGKLWDEGKMNYAKAQFEQR